MACCRTMAFDPKLAERVRSYLQDWEELGEKKMFGGLCFVLRGNMLCGIVENRLMLRVGPDAYEACMKKKYALPMDFTGRVMKGMIYVDPQGLRGKKALGQWLDRALDFVSSLPAK